MTGLLANRASRRRFGTGPQLDDVQHECSNACAKEGYAMLPFTEPVPDPVVWHELEADGARSSAETGGRARARARGRRVERATPAGGQGVRRPQVLAPMSSSASTTRGCASGRTRACSILRTRISACGRSSSTSTSGTHRPQRGGERMSSQRWHRDFNDRHLLKAFLYLVDVDEETGPFEYVPRSAPGGELEVSGHGGRSATTTRREDELARRSTAGGQRSRRRKERSSSATRPASTAAASRQRSRACSRR